MIRTWGCLIADGRGGQVWMVLLFHIGVRLESPFVHPRPHLPNEVFDAHQPLFCHAELTRQGNDGLLSSKELIFSSHAISPTRITH